MAREGFGDPFGGQRRALVGLARQAPVGREIDKDQATLSRQGFGPLHAEWFPSDLGEGAGGRPDRDLDPLHPVAVSPTDLMKPFVEFVRHRE